MLSFNEKCREFGLGSYEVSMLESAMYEESKNFWSRNDVNRFYYDCSSDVEEVYDHFNFIVELGNNWRVKELEKEGVEIYYNMLNDLFLIWDNEKREEY